MSFGISDPIQTPEGPVRTFWVRDVARKLDWQGIAALASPMRSRATVLVWLRPEPGAPWSWAASSARELICDFLCRQLDTKELDIIDLESLSVRRKQGLHVEVTQARMGKFYGSYLNNYQQWEVMAKAIGVPGRELLELMQSTVEQAGVAFNVQTCFRSYIEPKVAFTAAPVLNAEALHRLRRFNAQMSVNEFARWLQVPENDVLAWESDANGDGRLAPTGPAARLLDVLARSSVTALG